MSAQQVFGAWSRARSSVLLIAALLVAVFPVVSAIPAAASLANQVTVSDATASESATAIVFTVTVVPPIVDGDPACPCSVDYQTVAGSATAGADYTTTSDTLTFQSGQSTATISVPLLGDATIEQPEQLTLQLSNPDGVSIADGSATGTITDDDGGPAGFTIFDASLTEGASPNMEFRVTRSPATAPAALRYTTSDGTARSGSDYSSTPAGIVLFTPGQTTATISVPVTDDTIDEPDQTFTVTISSDDPSAAILDGSAVGTIIDDDGLPGLAVSDPTTAEGSDATFTVSLTSATEVGDVTVAYATAGGTATSGVDYTASSGTATIPMGSTSVAVPVPTTQDTLDEADETFTLNLSDPTNATIADATGTGTISDDDTPPTASFVRDETGPESASLTFTVQLSAPSGRPVTLGYSTANGTATAPADYTAASSDASVTIAAGQTTGTIVIPVVDDGVNESDETFSVSLEAPSDGTATLGSKPTATGTIEDDDAGPELSVNDVTVTEGSSASPGTATFTVRLDGGAAQQYTVTYRTVDGEARQGIDYQSRSGVLVFQPGETTKSVAVPLVGDSLAEPTERFTLVLADPDGGGAVISDGTGQATITDDDEGRVAEASAEDASTLEANTTVEVTVTLAEATNQNVTVHFETEDGTATSPGDYLQAEGDVLIPAGETEGSARIAVRDDQIDEDDETFTVVFSAPGNAELVDDTAEVTIEDNDAPPTVSVADAATGESSASGNHTVTLSAASGRAVTVAYAVAKGSGTASDTGPGQDFQPATGTLRFEAGSTTATIPVSIIGDSTDEPDETYAVTLSEPSGATIADGSAVGTITDDDSPPAISVSDARADEGTATGGQLVFTITLSAVSSQPVTFSYATANGTAVAPSDYTAKSGTATIAAGSTSTTVAVSVVGDATDEPNETMTLTASSPQNATLADASGTGTILDDDGPPSFSIGDATVVEGQSGTTPATFEVRLLPAPTATTNVSYATADDTAKAASDYTATTGTLAFAAGETQKTITVSVIGETVDEADERFFVNLSAPTNGATLGDNQGVGAISDDDGPTISVNDLQVAEEASNGGAGSAAFIVSLSAASTQAVSVAYATVSDTASSPGDYAAASGRVSFAAGETSKTVAVALVNDDEDEPDEEFGLRLSEPQGGTIAKALGVATITDQDGSEVERLAGSDRTLTAIDISQDGFPAADSAGAVVLARADSFADALAGTALAVSSDAPLLLTASSALDSRVKAEVDRVLGAGGRVYLLGGTAALSDDVARGLAGYDVQRVAGADRYATAVEVADTIGSPSAVLLATGTNFPDALSAGAAAAAIDGVVLLTNGDQMPSATKAWLDAHPSVNRYALGGPAAVADPTASPIVGADRYATAAKVAATFFDDPSTVGVASGLAFADALGGGSHIGAMGGPLLLTATNDLPGSVSSYLRDNGAAISDSVVYGGTAAVSTAVAEQVREAIA